MSELDERDWELINAYHDGELSAAEARDLEHRMQGEPELSEALARVARLSASLSTLRPAPLAAATGLPAQPPASGHRRSVMCFVGGALAATLACAAIYGVVHHRSSPNLFQLHSELVGLERPAADPNLVQVAFRGSEYVPDLTGAKLTPVVSKPVEGGTMTHYVGLNGCRLTYFRGEDIAAMDGLPAHAQVASWTNGTQTQHMIVATGMDPAKFDAITAYLKRRSHQQERADMLAALGTATTTAAPCLS